MNNSNGLRDRILANSRGYLGLGTHARVAIGTDEDYENGTQTAEPYYGNRRAMATYTQYMPTGTHHGPHQHRGMFETLPSANYVSGYEQRGLQRARLVNGRPVRDANGGLESESVPGYHDRGRQRYDWENNFARGNIRQPYAYNVNAINVRPEEDFNPRHIEDREDNNTHFINRPPNDGAQRFKKGGKVKGPCKNKPVKAILHTGEVVIPNTLPNLQKEAMKQINKKNKVNKKLSK